MQVLSFLLLCSLLLGCVAPRPMKVPFKRTNELLTVRWLCTILLSDGVVMPDPDGYVNTAGVVDYLGRGTADSDLTRAALSEWTWGRWLRAGRCTDLLGREYIVRTLKKSGEDYISISLPEIEVNGMVHEAYSNSWVIRTN